MPDQGNIIGNNEMAYTHLLERVHDHLHAYLHRPVLFGNGGSDYGWRLSELVN